MIDEMPLLFPSATMVSMKHETWMPIRFLAGRYEISDYGQIRNALTGRVIKPFRVSNDHGKQGHLAVNLGKGQRHQVHHLVLEYFVGPRPPGLLGLHRDDDSENNWVGNLYWGTYSDNSFDAVRKGTHSQASKIRCPQDHPLDGVYYNSDGSFKQRYCKTCHKRTPQQKDSRKRCCQTPGCENGKIPGRANCYCELCSVKAREARKVDA